MEFRILGPLEVVEDGESLALAAGKQRALLAIAEELPETQPRCWFRAPSLRHHPLAVEKIQPRRRGLRTDQPR